MEHDIDVAPEDDLWLGKRTGTADGGHTALTVRDIQNPGHPELLRLRPADDPAASLTYHEREIIYAYRNRPELQHAVDILLGAIKYFVSCDTI